MDNEVNEKELTDTSNPWLYVSVVVTILVIILLVGNLFYSYYTIRNFEDKILTLERVSEKLLFHVKTLRTTTLLAASTGDLSWQKNYNEHKKDVEIMLEKIYKLIDIEGAVREIDNIKQNKDNLNKIGDEAYTLISQGKKDEAENILKSWNYIKNQQELVKSTENLRNIVQNYVQKRISFGKKIMYVTLVIIFLLFSLLVYSWYISIKTWRSNIKKRKEKENKIIYLNYHDFLTDLYNRRYIMEAGKDEIQRAQRYEQSLSFMMIDIDHFKKVNDNYGHAAGDEVLKDLAANIKNSIREVDIAGRLGGEEFSILLPKTDIEEAEKVAERLRKTITESSVSFEDSVISITVSIGLTTYNQKNSNNMDDLLQKADIALYEAKSAGRNCIVKNRGESETEI